MQTVQNYEDQLNGTKYRTECQGKWEIQVICCPNRFLRTFLLRTHCCTKFCGRKTASHPTQMNATLWYLLWPFLSDPNLLRTRSCLKTMTLNLFSRVTCFAQLPTVQILLNLDEYTTTSNRHQHHTHRCVRVRICGGGGGEIIIIIQIIFRWKQRKGIQLMMVRAAGMRGHCTRTPYAAVWPRDANWFSRCSTHRNAGSTFSSVCASLYKQNNSK